MKYRHLCRRPSWQQALPQARRLSQPRSHTFLRLPRAKASQINQRMRSRSRALPRLAALRRAAAVGLVVPSLRAARPWGSNSWGPRG